ncbi:MAG: hypothetical protein GY714_06930 [Desulfobacterales bacterium]|nr:hypothetical protein [Desulfobacterales bacterium]
MKDLSNFSFFSGGLKGTEASFGENVEKWGIKETNFSFEGHELARDTNAKILSKDEMKLGDISMEIVSARLKRKYAEAEKIRKVFQVIFHIVNSGYQVFSVGRILEDKTVKGGTGWGVELGIFFNRPVSVYDQDTNKWYTWKDNDWAPDTPVITNETFCVTGTRYLTKEGREAIDQLFERSFG